MALNLPKKPKQSFLDKVRDVVDANTAADQYRRAQAGQPIQYRDQQAQRQSVAFNQPTRQVSFGATQPVGAPRPSAPPKPQVAWNQPTNPVTLPKQQATPQLGAGVKPLGTQQITKSVPGGPTNPITLGIGRSLTGTAQSASGFIDAISPGTGTSQFTKDLNRNAEGIDKKVKDLNLNTGLYKAGQIGTDIATFLIPGATAPKLVTKGTQALSKAPVAGRAVSTLSKGVQGLEKGGKAARATATTAKYATRPDVVANVLTDTALNTGFRAAREQDISPGTIALDSGISFGTQGALTGAGKAIKAGVNKLGDKLISDDVLTRANLPTGKKPVAPGPSTANPQAAKPVVKPKQQQGESLPEIVARQVQEQEDKLLKYRGIEKIRAKGREISRQLYNPFSEAERFDLLQALAQGKKVRDLNAGQRLTYLLQSVGATGSKAAQIRKEAGIDKLIQKYTPGTDLERDFITYLAAKRDINVAATKKKRIFGDQELDDVAAFVKQYETDNPDAVKDLAVLNKHFRSLLDDMKATGRITKEDYDAAVASEDFYSPIERAMGSEDIPKTKVQQNRLAGGQQRSVQGLSGSANPIKQNWDAIINYTNRATKEAGQTAAYRALYNAAENNYVDQMVRMGMTAEQSRTIIEADRAIKELAEQSKKTKVQLKKASATARKDSKKLTAQANKAQSNAIKRIADKLEATDPDAAAALRGLGRKEQAAIFDWLSTGMTKSEFDRGLQLSGKARQSAQALQALRAQAEGFRETMRTAKTDKFEIVGMTDDNGKAALTGMIDGYPTWIETTPEMLTMLKGLDQGNLHWALRGLANIQRVWRSAWTGVLNPVFSVTSKLFYDPPMMAINHSGSRYQLNPETWAKSLGGAFTDVDDFFAKLQKEGALPVTGSRMVGDAKETAQRVAARKDVLSRLGFYAKHPVSAIEDLDVIGGKLAHTSRLQVALAEYARSKAKNVSHKAALQNAADAYNNVLPNYAVTNNLIRGFDAIIPYFGATIAGNRALTTAARRNPVAFGNKAGAFAGALAAVGVYARSDEDTQKVYQDYYDSGNQQVLFNNMVFVMPGVTPTKKEDGTWSGVVTIPIPPEFRAPNAIVQNATFEGDKGGYNPNAAAAASIATGGALSISREGGVQADANPAFDTFANLVMNQENVGGKGIAAPGTPFENMKRGDQAYDSTSKLARDAATAFNKLPIGDVSPVGVEKTIKSFGSAGRALNKYGSQLLADENTPDEQKPDFSPQNEVMNRVTGRNEKGMTDTKWRFKNQKDVRSTLTGDDLKQFDQVHKKGVTKVDAENRANTLWDAAKNNSKVWQAEKELARRDAEKTGRMNPLFELSDDQASRVLLYRSNQKMTRAKQTYAKDGTSLYQSLNLDEQWYEDFRKAEDAYWKDIGSKKAGEGEAENAVRTYSGKERPQAAPALQAKLDAYYKLPKGTGARSAFLAANPDIIAYWDKSEAFTNEERVAMGLDPLKDEDSKYGYGRGGSGGSRGVAANFGLKAYPSEGGAPKPKVSSKKLVKIVAKQKAIAKPKIKITKSKV